MDSVCGRPPLPLDARVRAWLIDRYAGDLVQAIGRTRAARSSHVIRCELWGGIDCPEMDQALARHGLEVETRWPNEVHRTERGRPSGASEADMQAEAAKMIAAGGVTVRALAARLRAQGRAADTTKAAAAVRAAKRAAKACSKNTIETPLVFLEQESKAVLRTVPPASRVEPVNTCEVAEKGPATTPTPAPAPVPTPAVVAANDIDIEFAIMWNRAHGRTVIPVPVRTVRVSP